jgi:hypothetical protein
MKLASSWALVPAGVFGSDLYEPIVTHQGSA